MFLGTALKTQAAYREAKSVELMLAGDDYDTIADKLGYTTRSGAWRAVQRALGKQREALAGEYLQLEIMRLDALQVSLWPQAEAGDPKAVNDCLRIIELRCALLGLIPKGQSGNQAGNWVGEPVVVGSGER